MGYNQHQSFFLRDRWLGKGLRALEKDPRFFFRKDAFEKIGLGKNMVQSLQHWLIAVNAAVSVGTGKNRVLEFTYFGEWLLNNDPALKYFDTIAMLHYNIVSQDEPSTSWYWYFNEFPNEMSDKETLFNELNEWVKQRETRKVSENSIRRDVDCLLRMYASEEETEDPEEIITSPFAKLKLIVERNETWFKNEINIPNNNLLFIKYALCKYSEDNDRYEISLEDILNEKKLLGKVYNMNSSQVIDALTMLENDYYYKVEFTRTNNLDIVQLPKMSIVDLLENHKF